ncbi:hypothetical protein F0U59_07500 [Archangium gephyra]|nr:hypothetical protein F0U59_07500 [Archangium gephyra]
MAVLTKGRRKLHREGRLFVWWVAPDPDGLGNLLHVISEDKFFHVTYELGQAPARGFVVVLGREFPGLDDAGGVWIRLRTPAWDVSAIGPGFVRRLIDWALDPGRPLLRVDCRSEPSEPA